MRLVILFVLLVAASPAMSRYQGVELEQVPVARLIENLEKISRENPNSAEAWLNLGRAHGMAYAQKTDPLTVPKAYHGIEPPAVPFGSVTVAADPTQHAAAQAHLEAALKSYRQALELNKDDLIVRLGLAWLTEQAGKKDEAVNQYRAIAADAWEKEKDLKLLGFGGRTMSGEVASYLIPLLDAEKDKHEIETLKDRTATLGKLPYPVTPIALPLADGLTATDLEAPDARVKFDVNGSGSGREWSWITPKAAWLVYDPKGEGNITSGRQLFGNVTFWMFWSDGYAPLAALDDNRDGTLTGQELANLALWHDANGNGVADPGEVKPLSAFGIVAVSYKWQTLVDHPDKIAFSPTGVTFQDAKRAPPTIWCSSQSRWRRSRPTQRQLQIGKAWNPIPDGSCANATEPEGAANDVFDGRAAERRRRHGEAERFGGFEVKDQSGLDERSPARTTCRSACSSSARADAASGCCGRHANWLGWWPRKASAVRSALNGAFFVTWSIIARDRNTGQLGIAVATRFFAVGALVPHLQYRIGAVATQALINPFYGVNGLELLREGKSAAEAVATLTAADDGRDHRQVHVMDTSGRVAAHTGAACVDWCGHRAGDELSLAGNMLAGPRVLEATQQAYTANTALPFARRLIAAMRAGEAAGGDKRGKQSAALVIQGEEDWPDLDLRVDDHADPLVELERLEAVSRERFTHFMRVLPCRRDPIGLTDRDAIEREIVRAIAAEGQP